MRASKEKAVTVSGDVGVLNFMCHVYVLNETEVTVERDGAVDSQGHRSLEILVLVGDLVHHRDELFDRLENNRFLVLGLLIFKLAAAQFDHLNFAFTCLLVELYILDSQESDAASVLLFHILENDAAISFGQIKTHSKLEVLGNLEVGRLHSFHFQFLSAIGLDLDRAPFFNHFIDVEEHDFGRARDQQVAFPETKCSLDLRANGL